MRASDASETDFELMTSDYSIGNVGSCNRLGTT